MDQRFRFRLLRIIWILVSPTALCSLLALLLYLAFRVKCILSAYQAFAEDKVVSQADRPHSLAFAWVFLTFEVLSFLPNILSYLPRILAIRRPQYPTPALVGNDVPSVDVLITCCNEERTITRDTVLAACTIDYPASQFRIFVCDDGAANDVREMIEELRVQYSNLFYTSRAIDARQHHRAGNLNHGLRYSRLVLWPAERSNTVRPRWMDRLLLRDTSLEQKPDTRTSRLRQSLSFDAQRKSLGGLPDVCRVSMAVDDEEYLEHYFATRDQDGGIRLQHYETLGTIVSEYVAVLNADTIPEPRWLRTIVAPLAEDTRIALACPPQTFYKIPVNDPLTRTESHVAGIAGVVDSSLDNAACQGPGYAVRRSAIEGIGGFPTESLAEDACCSTSLLGAGWRTVFVHEALQYGEAPSALRAHIDQRMRRFVGQMQNALLFRSRFTRSRGGHFTFLQRLAGLTYDLQQFAQVLIALNFVVIPFALWSGYPMVIWTDDDELRWLVRLVTIWLACHWLHQGLMGMVASLANARFEARVSSFGAGSEQWLAPYILLAFIRSFLLPRLLSGKTAAFTTGRSAYFELNERGSPRNRIRNALLNHLVLMLVHLLFIVATILGVALATLRAVCDDNLPTLFPVKDLDSISDTIIYLIARIGWPPLIWTQYLTSCISPLLYVLFQRDHANRETLLDRDPSTGVAHPTFRARSVRTNGWVFWRYLRIFVVGPYVGILLILSFLF
ncbi:Cellulose synthase catalytic subunit [UDP-forming] [Pseudocercospora fuligena]|uniref:Cellulose synthase catalytic subunit [UDP-forming] n=1 Tax=Pseudocercospora fuligena TaxID=685502 RepID=A0A8H6VCR7_9PEZI|nr:Cellulose synthase catalytic subunit [UDP-forming] [Pseudocercospora fuligena]